MHISQMLLGLSIVFFAAIFLMCLFREKLKRTIVNILFVLITAIFFFCWNYAAYEFGWLDDGFMTLENISPYICTVIILTPFMNKWVKDYAYCAIAFLGFGMFLALFVSPQAEYLLNYRQEANFMHISEGACHLVMALYGFYLILSNKVTLQLKNFLKALAFIYASVSFGIFINIFFHRSNFGMDMYGNYSIYFLDIFGSFGATLIAYVFGILLTMTLGFMFGIFLDWVSKSREETGKTE